MQQCPSIPLPAISDAGNRAMAEVQSTHTKQRIQTSRVNHACSCYRFPSVDVTSHYRHIRQRCFYISCCEECCLIAWSAGLRHSTFRLLTYKGFTYYDIIKHHLFCVTLCFCLITYIHYNYNKKVWVFLAKVKIDRCVCL